MVNITKSGVQYQKQPILRWLEIENANIQDCFWPQE